MTIVYKLYSIEMGLVHRQSGCYAEGAVSVFSPLFIHLAKTIQDGEDAICGEDHQHHKVPGQSS